MRKRAIALMLIAAVVAGACSTDQPHTSNPLSQAISTSTAVPTATPAVTATAIPIPTPTQVTTATPTVKPTITTVPPDPLFTYTYAVRLLRAAQYEDAISQFSIVVRILPDFALAYHGRGLSYYHEEQEELAQEDFSKAIELKPDYADAYRNRGVIYMNAGEVLKGVADLQRAMELFEDAGDTRAVEEVKAFLSPSGP